jgi:LysR family transcriptional regulator for metE and metH
MITKLRDVTIRQLRALASVAVGGSVTAAANKLHLTQPAVTLQLRNLQQLCGLPLLQRTSDGMVLTPAGQELYTLFERIEAAIESCATSLDMITGRTGGRISIGAVSTAKYFVPFAISAFSKLHPGMDISLTIVNRQDIRQALRSYALDFAIMGHPPPDIELDRHLIGDHPHVVIAPTGHRLANASGLSAVDLAHERFVSRKPGSGTRFLMEQFFENSNLEPQIGMEMSSNETIKQAVIAGLGIAFISAHTVAVELKEGRMITLDITGLPIIRQWFVVRRKDKVLLPPAQEMLDFLVENGKQFLPQAPLSSGCPEPGPAPAR